MIKKIRNIFSKLETDDYDNNTQEDVNITCAALLIETAYADKTLEKDEINSLRSCLQEVYGLEEHIVESLIIESEASIKNSTSLYEYTKPLNDNLNYKEKLLLINTMWKIAYADNSLDKYEEHLIRKIAGLLYIDHTDFISEKLKAR